jgi:hypothetical protein
MKAARTFCTSQYDLGMELPVDAPLMAAGEVVARAQPKEDA